MILMVILFRKREKRIYSSNLWFDESESFGQMMNMSRHRSCLALVPGTLPILYTGSQRFIIQVSGRLQSCIL